MPQEIVCVCVIEKNEIHLDSISSGILVPYYGNKWLQVQRITIT